MTTCTTDHKPLTYDPRDWRNFHGQCPYCWVWKLLQSEERKEVRRAELFCGLGNTL